MHSEDHPYGAMGQSRRGQAENLAADASAEHRAAAADLPLKSRVVKRSIVIGGHRTSISLEDAFWDGLKQIAHGQHSHLSDVVNSIDMNRKHCNLSSAIRLYVFDYFHK